MARNQSGESAQRTNVSRNPGRSVLPSLSVSPNGRLDIAWADLDQSETSLRILHSWKDGNDWTPPKSVSLGEFPAHYPSLTGTGPDNLHLVWMQGRGKEHDVYYSQFSSDQWSSPINISNNSGISQRPQVAVDLNGRVHVVWFDNTNGFFELFHAIRENGDWLPPKNTKLVDWYITESPSFGRSCGMEVDHDGKIHVVWIDIFDFRQDVFHSHWDGTAWSRPENLSGNIEGNRRPREARIAIDTENNLNIAWQDEGTIRFCRRVGNRWGNPMVVSEGVPNSVHPEVMEGKENVVHIAWTGERFGQTHLFHRMLDDSKWTGIALLTDSKGAPDGCSLGFHPPNTLHVSWMDDSVGNVEIFHKSGPPDLVAQVARLDPKTWPEFVGRGKSHLKMGEADKALADFNRAIELSDNLPEPYHWRASFWRSQRQFEKSISDFSKVIELTPDSGDAFNDRGAAWLSSGNVDQALSDFSRAIQLSKTDPRFLFNRSVAWTKKGEWGKAADDLRNAIQLDPKMPTTLNALAWLKATAPESEIRNGKEAVELATRACQLSNWRNLDFAATLAAAYAENGEFERAVQMQQAICERSSPFQERACFDRLESYRAENPFRESAVEID